MKALVYLLNSQPLPSNGSTRYYIYLYIYALHHYLRKCQKRVHLQLILHIRVIVQFYAQELMILAISVKKFSKVLADKLKSIDPILYWPPGKMYFPAKCQVIYLNRAYCEVTNSIRHSYEYIA
jgi:hypothetical protein